MSEGTMNLEHHPGPAGAIRASDAERERVGRLLDRHFADGRLTVDEFTERMESVFEARTRGELLYALRELPVVMEPPPGIARPAPAPKRRRRSAGAAVVAALLVLSFLLATVMLVGAVTVVRSGGPVEAPVPGPAVPGAPEAPPPQP
jgi:hypothetical protein